MRVGINLPQYAIDFADASRAAATTIELARVAEAHGLDDVWVSDHPFVVGPDGVVSGALDPFVTLAAVAHATERIGIGTLVLASTMRAPAIVGHMARTLPASRLTIGAGAGWYRAEHRAFGVTLPPFEERMKLLEATLIAAGRAGARPLAGGVSEEAIKIASRVAGAWNAAWDPPRDAFRSRSERLDAACEAAGRTPAEVSRSVGVNVLVAPDEQGLAEAVTRLRRRAAFLESIDAEALRRRIILGTPSECAERISAYGADEVVVTLALRDDAIMLRCFADEVATRLR